MMSSESFYKDDVLGYVSSSNSIPWLYDLDTCCAVTTETSLTTEKDVDDGGCKVCAEDSMFSVTRATAIPSVSKPVSLSNDAVQSGQMSRDDGFMKSFIESLRTSVIHDDVDVDERKLVPDGAAMSKLTKLYVRNVAVLGVAITLSQAPFYGVRSLQSSLNGSPGRWALVAYHVALIIVTPLVRSTAVSARIRPKTAVILSIIAGLPFAIVGAFRVSLDASVLLLVTAAAAGAAMTWMSEMHDTYLTSLGVLCAALSDDQRSGGKAAAKHFLNVFSQYLLVMQQLSLFVGNFVTSSIYLTTHNIPEALLTSLGRKLVYTV